MASVYTSLKKGSSGNEVSALQTALNKKGYTLANTGLYDDATEAAVRQYQTDNNLEADGIAGDITLGALYGTSTQNTGSGYRPSAQLTEAQKYAESVAAQRPADYNNQYAQQLQAQFDAIMNRQPFTYDIGSDAMFQQMSDMYSQQARRGMQDAMGQAAALTGGYGNSYAQAAGQAAYGQQMQQLSALAPEYMNNAYSRWQNEGVDMMNRYNMLAQQEESDYARYIDAMNTYFADVDRAQQAADNLYNREYSEYLNNEEMAWQREQQKNKLDSENRAFAYDTALLMLQGGKMPSAELLLAAGLSEADAQTILSMFKKSSGGSGKAPIVDFGDQKITGGTGTGPTGIRDVSGEDALKAAAEAGTVKLTNTDTGDGFMSYQDWQNNQIGLPQTNSEVYKSIVTGADSKDKNTYNDKLASSLLSDVYSGKMDAVDAYDNYLKLKR